MVIRFAKVPRIGDNKNKLSQTPVINAVSAAANILKKPDKGGMMF